MMEGTTTNEGFKSGGRHANGVTGITTFDDKEGGGYIDDDPTTTTTMQRQQEREQTIMESSNQRRKRDRRLFSTLYIVLFLSLSGLAFSITKYVQARVKSSASSAEIASSLSLEEIDPNRDPVKYRSDITAILSTVVEFSTLLEGPQKKALDWLVFDDVVLTSTEIEAMMEGIEHSNNNDDDIGVPIFPLVQRYALMVLFFGTNGELWSDKPWSDLTTVNECDFMGVNCGYDHQGEVDGLDLQYRKLRGRLPDEVGLLKQLATVNLMSNNLEGSIPSFFYNELTDLGTYKYIVCSSF